MSETQAVSSQASPQVDLFRPLRSEGAIENPFAIYSLLRSVRPVMRMPTPGYQGPGVWFLTRYDDVHEVLRNPSYSVDRLRAPFIRDNFERMPSFLQRAFQNVRSMLTMDPPDHTRVRKLANKAFTPKRIAALHTRVEEIVGELLAEAPRCGTIDIIETIAAPLPAIVIAELLGVPAEDHRTFKNWASDIVAGLGEITAEQRRAQTHSADKLLTYLGEIITARRSEPRDDLISALILAQEEKDALSDIELLATCNLLLLAGHETTTNLIGNGLLALMREPDQLALLRSKRELMPTAIEELLRYDGPVQTTVRVALEDLEIDGNDIEEGSLIMLGIGAANHDPEVFDDPRRLDITRDPNPHLAFGFGTHFCLGAPLARLEGKVAFNALLDAFPEMELVDEAPRYRSNPILRGLESLPVKIRTTTISPARGRPQPPSDFQS